MIVVNLDVMMANRKIGLGELADKVDIPMANLSVLTNNMARAVRITKMKENCRAMDCQPGDILAWEPDKEENDGF